MEDYEHPHDDRHSESEDDGDWPLAWEWRVFAVGLFWIIPPASARLVLLSNPRPSAWEADALPTELRPRWSQG